ncbi:MAG: hypothetical protein JNJ97_07710, partial [Alphaproteobacteria bacterium]|nr:hypothetical protein [Alphaproteobacteria bacterium]
MFLVYLIIGTILAFALWQIVKGLIDAKPANVVKGAKIGGAVLGGIAGLW